MPRGAIQRQFSTNKGNPPSYTSGWSTNGKYKTQAHHLQEALKQRQLGFEVEQDTARPWASEIAPALLSFPFVMLIFLNSCFLPPFPQ